MRYAIKFIFAIFIMNNVGVALGSSFDWNMKRDSELVVDAKKFQQLSELPDAYSQVLYRATIEISNGKIRKHVQSMWFFPTADAVQSYGNEIIYFDQEVDAITVHLAASLNSQQQLQMFDSSTLKVLDSDSYNTFSDSKQALIALPGLDKGSISLIDYTVTTDYDTLESDWSEMIFPQTSYPRTKFELEVTWDQSFPVKWHSSSEFVSCFASKLKLQCTGNDIPAVKSDSDVIWRDELGQIILTQNETWQQVIDQSLIAFTQSFNDVSGSDTLFEEITNSSDSVSEKIKKIHEFVSRDIRYMSMSEYGHAITPHSISSIVSNRYGDCKDKSALLVNLLNKLDIDAYPVLVATNRNDASKLVLPTMNYFDHMVVCFTNPGSTAFTGQRDIDSNVPRVTVIDIDDIEDENQQDVAKFLSNLKEGKSFTQNSTEPLAKQDDLICLDSTNTDTNWRYTPAWVQGKVALALKPDQTPHTIAKNKYRWRLDIDTIITITDEGGEVEHQKRTYFGEFAGAIRRVLAGKTAEERVEWAVQYFQEVIGVTTVTPEIEIIGADDLGEKLVINTRAHYDPFLDIEDNLYLFEYDYWVRNEIDSFLIKNKIYSSHFQGSVINTKITIDVGDRWRLGTLTAVLSFDHKYGSMSRNVSRTSNKLMRVTTQLKIAERDVTVENKEAFNQFLNQIKRESSVRLSATKMN